MRHNTLRSDSPSLLKCIFETRKFKETRFACSPLNDFRVRKFRYKSKKLSSHILRHILILDTKLQIKKSFSTFLFSFLRNTNSTDDLLSDGMFNIKTKKKDYN